MIYTVSDLHGCLEDWKNISGEQMYEMAETDPEVQDILEDMYFNIAVCQKSSERRSF